MTAMPNDGHVRSVKGTLMANRHPIREVTDITKLTPKQRWTLWAVSGGGLNQKEVHDRIPTAMAEHKADPAWWGSRSNYMTFCSFIKEMEQRGLVEREAHAGPRGRLIRPTPRVEAWWRKKLLP
jgi:hypothetical protein